MKHIWVLSDGVYLYISSQSPADTSGMRKSNCTFYSMDTLRCGRIHMPSNHPSHCTWITQKIWSHCKTFEHHALASSIRMWCFQEKLKHIWCSFLNDLDFFFFFWTAKKNYNTLSICCISFCWTALYPNSKGGTHWTQMSSTFLKQCL